jgi:hypothetical protein
MTAAVEAIRDGEVMPLDINRIRIDGGTQPRVQLDGATVAHYAEAILHHGAKFPPIDVFFDGAHYWLADGFHRLFAHQMLAENDAVSSMLDKLGQDVTVIDAMVHHGTQRQAILFSVGANAHHGLPRKPEDKRQAIRTLIRDIQQPCSSSIHFCRTKPEDEQCWNAWADRAIARECGVSHSTVADEREKFMAELRAGQVVHSTTRTYNHPATGQPTAMDVSNIGRITPVPSPEQVAERAADVEAMPTGYQADIEDYAPTSQPDGVHPATERAIDIAIKLQIVALSLKITPPTFADALPPLMHDKVTATLDTILPWLKALEVKSDDD